MDGSYFHDSILFLYLPNDNVFCKECSVQFKKEKIESHLKYVHLKVSNGRLLCVCESFKRLINAACNLFKN